MFTCVCMCVRQISRERERESKRVFVCALSLRLQIHANIFQQTTTLKLLCVTHKHINSCYENVWCMHAHTFPFAHTMHTLSIIFSVSAVSLTFLSLFYFLWLDVYTCVCGFACAFRNARKREKKGRREYWSVFSVLVWKYIQTYLNNQLFSHSFFWHSQNLHACYAHVGSLHALTIQFAYTRKISLLVSVSPILSFSSLLICKRERKSNAGRDRVCWCFLSCVLHIHEIELTHARFQDPATPFLCVVEC